MTNVAEGMLHLLSAEPTLLPEAPPDAGALINRRTQDEIHACLRCGEQAQLAYVADTLIGPRWLDLCYPCGSWLRASVPADVS
ncbi:hypothetical protein ACQEU3_46880 [Spirillospora sp. CA-253888]